MKEDGGKGTKQALRVPKAALGIQAKGGRGEGKLRKVAEEGYGAAVEDELHWPNPGTAAMMQAGVAGPDAQGRPAEVGWGET